MEQIDLTRKFNDPKHSRDQFANDMWDRRVWLFFRLMIYFHQKDTPFQNC